MEIGRTRASVERPTEALYGSIELERSVDEPKRVAWEHLRRKMVEEMR